MIKNESATYRVGYVAGALVFKAILNAAWALVLAVPLMLLTDFLYGYGSPVVPLSYWQSWWAALLFSWLVGGSNVLWQARTKR